MIITHTLKLWRCVTRASTRPQPRKLWNISVHLVVCLFVGLSVHSLNTSSSECIRPLSLFISLFSSFSVSFSFILWLFSVVLLSLPLRALKTLSSFWCMSTASEDEVEWRSKCGFAALPLDVGSLPVCNVEATWVCFGWFGNVSFCACPCIYSSRGWRFALAKSYFIINRPRLPQPFNYYVITTCVERFYFF